LNTGEVQQIACYELLSPNPIPNFAYDVLHNINAFSQDNVKYIQNSTRFSYSRYLDLLKERKSREMRTDDIKLPYWENVARYKEGRMMYVALWQWICAIILFVIVFVNLMVFIAKHKPSKETFTKMGDKFSDWKRKRKTKTISFDAGEDLIPEKLYEEEDEEFEDLEEEPEYSEEEAENPYEGETVSDYEEQIVQNVEAEFAESQPEFAAGQEEFAGDQTAFGEDQAKAADYIAESEDVQEAQEAYDVYSNPANAYGYIDENGVKEEGTDDE
jgi:hypothetical protein